MAKPVCRILIPATLSEAFQVLNKQFEGCGLFMKHPENRFLITRGRNGEATLLQDEDLKNKLAAGETGSLAFWLDGKHEMIMVWKQAARGYMFSLHLEHMDSQITAALCARLTQMVLTRYAADYDQEQALVIAFA